MSIAIDVTEQDIEEGSLADCYCCPVALAIKRATGATAHVMDNDVLLEDLDLVTDLPRETRSWIRSYDISLTAAPFSFVLPDLDDWVFDPDRGRDDDGD